MSLASPRLHSRTATACQGKLQNARRGRHGEIVDLTSLRAGGADFVSQSPRFCFERADGELDAALAVAQIFAHEWLEAAAAFALRDVRELVQEQFAVTPGIGADNDAVADGHAARSLGDDLGAPGGLG